MSFAQKGMIAVGDDAKRFRKEPKPDLRHGKTFFHGAFAETPMPENIYCILDETTKVAAPLYGSWSEQNNKELQKGWLIKGDTIEELAEKVGLSAAGLTTNDQCLQHILQRWRRS